jgi:hypothetical protein
MDVAKNGWQLNALANLSSSNYRGGQDLFKIRANAEIWYSIELSKMKKNVSPFPIFLQKCVNVCV